MNSNKSPSIVAGMCFIAGFIHFLSILEFCTPRSQTLNHTQASCSSHSFLFELYSTLKASLRMHEWTSFSPSENFVLIAEKRKGCLEREGETMGGGWKFSDAIMNVALDSFQPRLLYVFLTIIPFGLCVCPVCPSTILNRSCIGAMVMQQTREKAAFWRRIEGGKKSRSENCFINTLPASAHKQMKEKRPCLSSTYAPIQSEVQH